MDNPETGEKSTAPLYDGTVFHRDQRLHDPRAATRWATAQGGPGYQFETSSTDLAFRKPVPAGHGQRRAGDEPSQFFITVSRNRLADPQTHTIFGEVVDEASQKIVNAIATTQTNPLHGPSGQRRGHRVGDRRGPSKPGGTNSPLLVRKDGRGAVMRTRRRRIRTNRSVRGTTVMDQAPGSPRNRKDAQGLPGCYRHPDRLTGIPLHRCDGPSVECMVSASVGFQCPRCVRGGSGTRRPPRTSRGRWPGGTVAADPRLVTKVLVGLCLAAFLVQLTVGDRFTDKFDMLGAPGCQAQARKGSRKGSGTGC